MSETTTVLRSDDGECAAAFDGTATTMSRQFSEETPDVVLSAATARLDALACVLRRNSWSGDSGMCAEERGVLLELMADMASEVRRLAQVNEAYVNQLQANWRRDSV